MFFISFPLFVEMLDDEIMTVIVHLNFACTLLEMYFDLRGDRDCEVFKKLELLFVV